jgi:5-methyltetrahydrofolate--homocysteine methyltransferase
VPFVDNQDMSRFLDALHSGRILLMDGAMGTELQRASIGEGECHELWNVTQPEKVRAIHQAYVDAGAECLVSNTFQANPHALKRHGVQERLTAILRQGIALARSAAGPDRFVLASIGPIGEVRDTAPDWCGNWFQQMLPALLVADALLLETYSRLGALDLARYLWQSPLRRREVPVLLSLAYRHTADGLQTQDGHAPEDFAAASGQYGIAALGVNCGRDIGMDEMIDIVRRYRAVTDLPLFARPNAGTPTKIGDRWVYPHTPEQMAARLPELLDAGISMVGGCCGTTPEHIAAFRQVVDRWNAR